MIEFLGDDAIVRGDTAAFTFEVVDPRREKNESYFSMDVFSSRPFSSVNGQWNVFPYGENNELPVQIRNIVYSNSISPGILNKKTGLNWGKGPKLYEEKFDEQGVLYRQYQNDDEIQSWLDTWDYETYLAKCATDFSHIESFFTKVVQNKGWRIGNAPKIRHLEHISPSKKPLVASKLYTPTHVLLPKEDQPELLEVFPFFDKFEPFKYPLSIKYSNLYTFASDFFSIPHILGSIPWIIQSNNVPKFLAALSKNSINIKYHITSPKEYWDQKRDDIKQECTDKGIDFKESMFKTFKRNMLKSVEKVLSGLENAGKFWHSEQVLVVEGVNVIEMGWKITVIDQKMQDTVQAQISIANKADKSTATGVGVHTAIGNISDSGESNSGSEQYYALNNYLQIGIDLPEMVIMDPMNAAIKANFPHKKLKMGLYHQEVKMQQDMSKEQRNLNAPR
ncbi:hypothetical protein [Chryseobacterium oncorhynchi]|uniref:Uncharacterized protein n=1 Tax=Chryseobacterium oncorhynchi TaxID=741074 RepID=A0A316X252_9FLAO|nr:hypothetical protein [Chryseobacterium oncorhynchi]PWN67604.1 hypothetical protein C1638_003160 [Chryseobacterium oncorhynchi]